MDSDMRDDTLLAKNVPAHDDHFLCATNLLYWIQKEGETNCHF